MANVILVGSNGSHVAMAGAFEAEYPCGTRIFWSTQSLGEEIWDQGVRCPHCDEMHQRPENVELPKWDVSPLNSVYSAYFFREALARRMCRLFGLPAKFVNGHFHCEDLSAGQAEPIIVEARAEK